MNKHSLQCLYSYNFWTHRRVWDCVLQLSEEQFTHELAYSIGSIRRQCWHTMIVEKYWFWHLNGDAWERMGEHLYPTRDAIRAEWEAIEAYAMRYLEDVSEARLMEKVVHPEALDEPNPEKYTSTVWEALMQVINHSTDHRAQILAGLHTLGAPTVEQDFFDYVYAEET